MLFLAIIGGQYDWIAVGLIITISGFIIFYVGVSTYILKKYEPEELLSNEKISKFGNFYAGVRLKRDMRWQAKMVYPAFLLERFVFTLIAYSLRGQDIFFRLTLL